MSARTAGHSYSIKEAAALTGLPASTLRYYESISVIEPVGRGETSKHRVYSEADLDHIMWVACLAATGMSVSDMRTYMTNGHRGEAAAGEQIELLAAQEARLARELEHIAVRRRYVQLKIGYWQAVEAGDADQTDLLARQARALADELKQAKSSN